MATRSVAGVDRALSRFRTIAAAAHIERHALHTAEHELPDLPRSRREAPDKLQVRGNPLIVIPSPAWPREDWTVPQRRRVRR